MDIEKNLMKLVDYAPKDDIVTSGEEVELVTRTLELENASNEELQEIRDTCVRMWSDRYVGCREDKSNLEAASKCWKIMQGMMSITAIIDDAKWSRGMEI